MQNRLISVTPENFGLLAFDVTPIEKRWFPRRDDGGFKIDSRIAFVLKLVRLQQEATDFQKLYGMQFSFPLLTQKCVRIQFSTL